MRTCKVCNIEKELLLFLKNGKTYRWTCKDCGNRKRRDEYRVMSESQEKKKNIPWNKGKKTGVGGPPKGTRFTEKHKALLSKAKKGIPKGGKGRQSMVYKKWSATVKKNCENTCQKCGATKNIHAHHIVPWEQNEKMRFDVNNGTALCSSCHAKLEGFQNGFIPWSLGRKFSKEHREKLSVSHKGQQAWNKGVPMKEPLKEASKLRFKGRSWRKCPETGKRVWYDKLFKE